MSLTERIIEIVEDARARAASDQEIDRALCQIGCTRIVHRADMMFSTMTIHGAERFIVLSGPVIEGQSVTTMEPDHLSEFPRGLTLLDSSST